MQRAKFSLICLIIVLLSFELAARSKVSEMNTDPVVYDVMCRND